MMKNYCLLLLLITTLFSCTDDTTQQNTVNANLLQRVDFFPGLAIETRWNFNADGLLIETTKADGTILQNFTYDANDRLTSSTLFNNDGTTETHTFTYDNNGFVTSVDGQTVTFDANLDAYYVGNLSASYRLTQINSEKLLTYAKSVYIDFDDNGDPYEQIWDEVTATYENNNLLSFSYNESCHSSTFDNNANPLKNATLAIRRAFSFIQNNRWLNELYCSSNNPTTHDYCPEDPESEVFNYTYNSNNLPLIQTKDNYYLGVFENTVTAAKYYYQGDVLP